MRLLLIAIAILAGILSSVTTKAQQQQQTLFEQALSMKLSQEITSSLACSTTLISAQRDLEAAKARIKELEAAK